MAFYSEANFDPDNSVGYLIRRIHQMGASGMEPLFAQDGLTGMQWSALVSICFRRGTTSADLARDLSHDKGAMTRLVDTLEERGWVTRQRDTGDRRIINLALTEEGEAVALRCKVAVLERWNAWLGDWEAGEIATLLTLLRKLRDTLETRTTDGSRA